MTVVPLAGLLLAQEAGFPIDTKVLASAGGLLCFFAWLMFRGMGRAEKRVDTAAATVVAAAAAERDRALVGESEAYAKWDQERLARMEDHAEFLRVLEVKNRELTQLTTEVTILRTLVPSPIPPPESGPTPQDGPTRR